MVTADDEIIHDMTIRDLRRLINDAIGVNEDLQTREAELKTEIAEQIQKLKSDMEEQADPTGLKASNLWPPKFTGEGDYSARAFLRKFDRYATHVQWDDNARFRSVPLFLENTADIWYGELNPAPTTFEQFQQALLRTFERKGSTFVDEQTFRSLRPKSIRIRNPILRPHHSRRGKAQYPTRKTPIPLFRQSFTQN